MTWFENMIAGEKRKANNATILVRVNFETKTCRRYVGRTMTQGYVFDSEEKITPELVAAMRHTPDTVGIVEQPREAA